MNVKVKILLGVTLIFFLLAMPVFSVGQQETSAREGVKEIAQIKWALRINPESGEADVEAAMNEILGSKLGINVDILPLSKGEFTQKLNLMMAAGDALDVTFISSQSWGGNFYQVVSKGGLLPLDDLLNEYGQGIKDQIPAKYWEAVKVNGSIMGVPNYQILARSNGFRVQERFLDKYGYDIAEWTKLEDIEPFLQDVKDNEPKNVIPWFLTKTGIWASVLHYYQLDEVADAKTPGVIRFNDMSFTVINQFATPEFEEHVQLMHKWYKAGFIQKDAAVITDMAGVAKTGNVVAEWGNHKPGDSADLKARNGGFDIAVQVLDTPYVNTNSVVVTLSGIVRQSENPEKAMQFINEINTNKELYNLAIFGLEGINYNKIDANRIELIENSGWFPNAAWGMGSQFNAYLIGNQPDDVWEQTIELNESAKASPLLGFVFDPSMMKSELTNVLSVYDSYAPALITGTADPDELLPEFIEKLNEAGAEKIIVEMQKQLDIWVDSK
ncbi:MAG: extracellular solute-binding protein [Spirochaetales bacterium]|nr:extracellular solute-binding protein [Spirochaetales bacterium]